MTIYVVSVHLRASVYRVHAAYGQKHNKLNAMTGKRDVKEDLKVHTHLRHTRSVLHRVSAIV